MGGIIEYREIIKQILQEYASYPPSVGDIEMQTIFDDKENRYQLMAIGWQGKKRIHSSVIHIDIIGGKVWLQQDSTDAEIARQMVERGIPADHIVLGFQPEHYRQYSEFAVN